MSRIRSKNTKIELILRKSLFKKGLRYRVNYKKLPGKPDIVFPRHKVAIFVDGDFWHGNNFETRKHSYSEYWLSKIRRNMERDTEVDKELKKMGWEILRIWGSVLKKDLENISNKIEEIVGR